MPHQCEQLLALLQVAVQLGRDIKTLQVGICTALWTSPKRGYTTIYVLMRNAGLAEVAASVPALLLRGSMGQENALPSDNHTSAAHPQRWHLHCPVIPPDVAPGAWEITENMLSRHDALLMPAGDQQSAAWHAAQGSAVLQLRHQGPLDRPCCRPRLAAGRQPQFCGLRSGRWHSPGQLFHLRIVSFSCPGWASAAALEA